MTKLLVVYVFGLSIFGCSSIDYQNQIMPSIVPKNEAINMFNMPEHGIVTDQDMLSILEHSYLNAKYTMDF